MASGAAWSLVSLWCLARLLHAWLGPQPSRWRVIGWLVVKFPLLYTAAWLLIRSPSISLAGFGLGFTVSLALALVGYLLRLPRLSPRPSHGR